jgi:hypothetical protein
MKKTYKGLIKSLQPHQIFVFGSNTEGRHGKGAALVALKNFGAKYGQAYGRQGQSYAIVTKNLRVRNHPSIERDFIEEQIKWLYKYATQHSELEFFISYSGEGVNLNSYTPKEMANMFSLGKKIPSNVIFEEKFQELLTI